MPGIRHAASFMLLPALLLAACAQLPSAPGAAVTPATPEEALYACQMRGAAAEDQYYWPRRSLGIDGAIARAQVTDACMKTYRRTGMVPR
ncbi:hypothetical protein [Roseomonas xinghualingensis]|uniref:hypothetical protein n=1 Tax=Roseomonas xinghualingensis TaxID=2986475 RepID=UPI0021F0DEB4|nr:hypothetical protein [Roseomonas sp. SXEYE001]MCV4205898.1 hypothetical protein [Roseomonas sp. SXEYE001]